MNDITTTPSLSILEGGTRPLPYPEPQFSEQQAAYPEIRPLELSYPAQSVWKAALARAKEFPRWKIVKIDDEQKILWGVATSLVFRFKDDFVVQVQSKDEKAVLQMRSRSRIGKSDFGVNGNRIKEFFAAVSESLRGS